MTLSDGSARGHTAAGGRVPLRRLRNSAPCTTPLWRGEKARRARRLGQVLAASGGPCRPQLCGYV